MKKVILVPVLLGVMGIGGIIAVTGGNITGSANAEKLTTSEVEKKALAEVKGTIRDIEFETGVTRSYYEVEVITDDAEYDLKLDAFSGELLKKTKERLDYDDTIQNTQTNTNTNTNTTNSAKNSNVNASTKAPKQNNNVYDDNRYDDYYDDLDDRYDDDLDDRYDDDDDDDRYDD
ncbi:PepSY domain-containing protein [Ureibacillus sp. FSL E2-3493]|uniref:PepSY domain-containing protein n=1 Tax=Ureibacillus sp. FSL E2-3493 TaxID=2921367 RepID=UPI003119F047